MVSRENKLEEGALKRCLGEVDKHLPHIVETDWRLDFVAETSELSKKNALQYTIKLKTDCSDQSDVTFVCSESQLEDLVYKLKEIIRHCEIVGS